MRIEYDIFISFKNLDENGNPTEDRELAYQLYEFLKSKGLNVFYSEIILEELGSDLWLEEIENALKVSKIFIAVGTRNEYFLSYWTNRERITFKTLKYFDNSKTIYSYIIPPMKIEDLPDDLKNFQCFENIEKLYRFISNKMSVDLNDRRQNEIPIVNRHISLSEIKKEKQLLNEFENVVFECENIFFKYKKKEDFILKDISFNLKYNEITALVGKNGNGKTTLLKIVANRLFPTEGGITYPEFFYETKSYCKLNIQKNISYLPSELKSWQGSLLDNLYFTLSSQGILGEENSSIVESVIKWLSLTKYLNKKWEELSSGYKIRFALAKIILNKPKLLVLDEPLANLDIGMQNIFLNDLKEIMKIFNQKLSIIISSHHIKEIENIADNLILLDKAKALYSGSIKDFEKNRKENLYEIIANISINKLKNIVNDLVIKIENRGNSFVLYTDSSVSSNMILNVLIKNDITIKYFMDISQSTIKKIG